MADTVRFYPGTLANQQTIINQLTGLAADIAPIGNVLFHTMSISGSSVTLKWKDPVDKERVTWAKTIIVKKQGSAPTSATDGTVVVTETVRDTYAVTGYVDTQTDPSNWYYRAFPVATSGAVSLSSENIFTTYTMYEYYIDEGVSDPTNAVVYEGANAEADPITIDSTVDPSPSAIDWGSWTYASTFFMPKPCMLKSDGTVDYYLDPDDYTKKADGETASDITDMTYDGNAMMEFPCIYMSAKRSGSRIHIKIADQKVDETFECFPCLKSDGTHASAFYMPIYEGYIVSGSGKIRSMDAHVTYSNAKCNSSGAQSTQVSNARANGSGWDVTTQAQEDLIKALGVLVFKTLDIPSACGGARSVTASSTQIVIGGGNTFGMFGGKFDGSWTTCKFFGMENWWGHVNRRVLGCVILDNQWLVKMTKHAGDGTGITDYVWSDTGSDYADYATTGIILPTTYSNAYITEMGGSFETETTKKMSAVFLPHTAVGGGSGTKYCDALYTSTGLRGAAFGGYAYDGVYSGPFYVNANNAPSTSSWTYGASLSYTRF